MQSANVLIETAVTNGQRPTQNSEGSSRADGGLFGNELKQQQQQQVEEQRSLKSQSSSNSEDRAANRSDDSSGTASNSANSDRSEDTAQQNGSDSSANRHVADSDSAAETGHVEQSAGVDDEVSENGISIHNRFNQINMVEISSGESSETVVSEGDDGASLQLVSQNGAGNETGAVALELPVIDESGNILPLNAQNGGSVVGDTGQQADHADHENGDNITVEGKVAAKTGINTGQLTVNEPKQTQAQEGVATGVEIKGANQAAVERTVVDKLMTGEVAPAAQAVVPAIANSLQTAASGHNDPLNPGGGGAAVANVALSQTAGNSDSSSSMTGRQQSANTGAMLPSAEVEGELEGASDKTATFLASLKSVAKGGANGADAQVLSPNVSLAGTKSQTPQISQMISQLSSLQSVSQSQAAPATASAPPAISAADSTPAMMTIATSMRQQGWDRAMGERLVFMARNGIQEAQIQVNPRQLGPIDIKVTVNQEQQTHVTFVTTTSAARETVDAAMPRLREMFDQAGLNLAESEVSQRDQQQSGKGESADDEGTPNGLAANGVEGDPDEIIAQQVGYLQPAGLDLFA